MDDKELLAALVALRGEVTAESAGILRTFDGPAEHPALANLADYLALRRRDLRPLQRDLMWRGLSSLGRLEGHVLPTLDAVIAALSAMLRQTPAYPPPGEVAFFSAEASLAGNTGRLLGDGAGRETRVMVTLPSEAATDPALVESYARAGMHVARINCAHDDKRAWRAMTDNVRAAAARLNRRIPVLMDIAGPKIRTGVVAGPDRRLVIGDKLQLTATAPPADSPGFAASLVPGEIVARLRPDEILLYNDGKLEAVVDSVTPETATLTVRRTRSGGIRLKPEKGINLPGTVLGLSPLTSKDEQDMETVIDCADLIGYSFISHPDDIGILERVIAAHGGRSGLGLVAKIERPEAVRNLPALIARAAKGGWPFGVMIARGDLAVEIGFERMAEMQEEILWLCEAAAVPAIWATQVLEGMVADGIPSRGEMTDVAMGARAECVMLNKGPHLPAAIALLDRLLDRMHQHMDKKTAMLRALQSWQPPLA
jgi:pyruvate kinase